MVMSFGISTELLYVGLGCYWDGSEIESLVGIPPRYLITQVNSALHPPGLQSQVPALTGLKVVMSPLPGGR